MLELSNETVRITATILIGIPATGKSTFCSNNFNDNHVYISMDILKSRSCEQKRVEECIYQQLSFVVDNTNVTKNDRARYITAAKKASYRVTGYYFESNVKDALARNQQRDKNIPDVAIFSVAKRLEQPAKEEGFDDLFYVKFDGNGGFVIHQMDMCSDILAG